MKAFVVGAIMALAVLLAVTTSSRLARYFAVFQFLAAVSFGLSGGSRGSGVIGLNVQHAAPV